MTEHRSRRDVLTGIGVVGALGVAGCLGSGGDGGDGGTDGTTNGTGGSGSVGGQMTVFHAGSLEPPFSDAESQFEEQYGVDVDREAKGSVGSTKKITEQGRSADVLGVSDFRLIRDAMMGEFAEWYGVFATNAMTVVYTDDSARADEFGPDTWWDVLSDESVNVAHSDPAVDPNGYRSVMAMRLGANEFDGRTLYDQSTARAMEGNAQVGAGTETELLAQVQSGALDYAWEYQSAGATHDVKTVDLQPHVDLSKATQEYARHYAAVSVEAGGTTYTGAPIAYGITVPSVATNPAAGAAWVEFFATEPGRQILRDTGFEPVETMIVPRSAESAVPGRVMDDATAQASLGPFDLGSGGATTTAQRLAPVRPAVASSRR